MQIRKCTLQDIHRLAEMNKCLIEDERSSNPMNLEQLTDRMRMFLETEYDAYLFVEDDATVGYALVRRTVSPLYLRQFYIVREFRRRHYGQEAFRALLEHLRTDTIDIEVLPWNERGLKFWRSLGFTETCIAMRLTK
ncbi:MAG: GNAT family N-acetyltransferase [Lachnospiraceae bacterium]|nr:GNAT family N-acetyltransferase [Lachnospiraceae bacterium]